MPINIAIVDDHIMVREGLIQLLELDGDIKVVGQAGDGVQCLDLLKKVNVDVMLLDINMPVMNGLEVLKIMRERNDNTKVIVLTIHNEVEYLLKAVDIGINGYMLKDSGSNELKKAIYSVRAGEIYIQPKLSPLLNSKLLNRNEDQKKINNLTKREIEVLRLLAEGMFNKEIASRLDISERTVKNHVSNIFKKITVADRTQAAVFAIRNNLIIV
ncbi:LuxR family two component transcriptional regulator [Lachnotalea glycerini]|uniref:Stage 0 sporulation protein A homolog n=1 Tax=Lachnotalea glycerini TaxID=1763509 RepID=A0A255I961_9FIRM|nr:response regulator transcription factor [Lachnotalea glycerini]PXV85329.1 LuxR family two component transcriptional regulator [Lachnotalea glycerini]RDY30216.1 DNA-binding response regulator [Lachnotalea glycerini]